MSNHRKNAEKIEEIFRTWEFQTSSETDKKKVLDEFYSAYLAKQKDFVQPVVNYLYTVDKLLPGFILSMLGGDEGPEHKVDLDALLKELREEYGPRLQDIELIPSIIKDRTNMETESLRILDETDLNSVLLQTAHFHEIINALLDGVFNRLAKNALIFPGFLIAKIASIALTPWISAQICERMPVKESAALVKHFDDEFLRDTIPHMKPHLTAEMASLVSFNRVAKIVELLRNTDSYSVMAEIYDLVPDTLAIKLIDTTVTSNAERANIIQFMQNQERIQQLSEVFTDTDRTSIREELKTLGSAHIDIIPA